MTDLSRLVNEHGRITIAALDHRGSLKEFLRDDEIIEWKRRMVDLYKNEVSGILIDPIYGKGIVDTHTKCGWLLSMEKTGYRGGREARITEILPGWSVKSAKKMGAVGVKLLLYYDPENKELAKQQKELATRVANECEKEEVVFLLEPLSYKDQENREKEVLAIVRDLKDIQVDIFKFEYPGSRKACEEISRLINKPWVLLSAGMKYDKYREALRVACESGASGFAVGRAVWQEFGEYKGKAREKYLNNVAFPRMRELVSIVNKYGKQVGQLRTIEQAEVEGKRVIVRVDWNVTLGKALQIVDDTRIVRALPTIKWLLSHGASQIVLMSHLGKAEEKKSLESVVKYASEILGENIVFHQTVAQCQSDTVTRVMMLENLRFWPGEESNDPEFAKQLASLGDIYVNEAFGESHRGVASIVGITKYLPSYAGLWLAEEVETINRVMKKPEKPFVVVMGGAKVEDKIKLLSVLSTKADTILLGGKLANEFVERKTKLPGKARVITPVEGSKLLDIGPKTIKIFEKEIAKAKTVVWNGPMGRVEDPKYRAGTEAVFEAIAANTKGYTLVGGGDTLAALHNEELLGRIDHVSTGGGAMLKLIEEGKLVGVDVLKSL